MTSIRGTHLLGSVLRLLAVAACVLPLAAPRQLAAAVGLTPPPVTAPRGPLPTTPVNEEDESEREEDAKARAANPRLDRGPDRHPVDPNRLPAARSARHLTTRTQSGLSRPAPEDPFRNGLGSPYRC